MALESLVETVETEAPEQVQEPVEVAETEEPSVEENDSFDVSTLLGNEEEDDTGDEDRRVPERTFLKVKSKNKSLKKELESLRAMLAQNQPVDPEPIADPIKMPNPEDFDNGIYDPEYQKQMSGINSDSIKDMVSKAVREEKAKLETESYYSKFQERVAVNLPHASERVEKYLSNPDKEITKAKAIIQSPEFQGMLGKIPIEISAQLTESKRLPEILHYYSKKPEKLYGLTKNNVTDIVEFGKLLGKVENFKVSKKSTPNPIDPVKTSSNNLSKLHPIRDHAKYDHTTKAGKLAWETDMTKMRKGEL